MDLRVRVVKNLSLIFTIVKCISALSSNVDKFAPLYLLNKSTNRYCCLSKAPIFIFSKEICDVLATGREGAYFRFGRDCCILSRIYA